MTLVINALFKTPVVRVFDKDANIAFFQETLGFKMVSEENTIAIFSSFENDKRTFIIEESPTYRTRAVNGITKHNKTIIKAAKASDIENLLARGLDNVTVFKGDIGYAFEATSPQGYTYLLHAEEDVTCLEATDYSDFSGSEEFKGLSDFEVQEIVLNVPNVAEASAFYQALNLNLKMSFVEAQGEDLKSDPDQIWDLEYLEFELSKDTDLAELRTQLEEASYPIAYSAKNLLVIKDTSNIEIWFSK